ncbi:MAG: energy transducer TonB [Agarilytica sp.]
MSRFCLITFVLFCFFQIDVSIAESGVLLTSKGLYVNEDKRDNYWVKYRQMHQQYPKKELSLKKEACVTVMFTIGKDGNVYDPSVVAIYPESNGRFEKTSIRAIKRSKYKPSSMNVERAPIITTHTFNFVVAEGTKKVYRERLDELQKAFDAVCKVDFVLK